MGIRQAINTRLFRHISIAPLVTFRVVFGLVMLASILRFWLNGWIEEQYIFPDFHFKYFGFYWVPNLPDWGYYLSFALMALSALGIALGAFYRISATLFFILFTGIELIDATYYLNHYYFVSVISFLLIFVPAHRMYSLDVRLGLIKLRDSVPALSIYLIMFQLGLVYFLAGIAKINSDWLFEAMPLSIWLPAQDDFPLIGSLFQYKLTAFAFSWGGMFYDLLIPFVLLSSRLRWLGYLAVIGFHLMTWFLFQIGMFPFIMIGATLIFFSANFHHTIHSFLGGSVKLSDYSRKSTYLSKPVLIALSLFICVQIALPFRYLLYPGNMFWHEQGYRFGWRVMLAEKAGYAQFKVEDSEGRKTLIDNSEFLTPVQEKMMSTQPDFMIQYAQYLKAHYSNLGMDAAAVKADVFVTLNGRASAPFIDPNIDLASQTDSWSHKKWILPQKSEQI